MSHINRPLKIAHRGNIVGPNPKMENNPQYIDKAVISGYNVEIDVWFIDGKLFLGHDSPVYEVNYNLLSNNMLWCHAKNLKALEYMSDKNIQCFWHEEDDYTLTSTGHIWTYPKKSVCGKSIIVCDTLEEAEKFMKKNIAGVCSDYVGAIK